jgi:hypothetical protein
LKAKREVQKQKEMAERLRIGGSASNDPVILDDDDDGEEVDEADEDDEDPAEILQTLEDEESENEYDDDGNEKDEGFSPHWAEPKFGEIVDEDEIVVVDLELGLNINKKNISDRFSEAYEEFQCVKEIIKLINLLNFKIMIS